MFELSLAKDLEICNTKIIYKIKYFNRRVNSIGHKSLFSYTSFQSTKKISMIKTLQLFSCHSNYGVQTY